MHGVHDPTGDAVPYNDGRSSRHIAMQAVRHQELLRLLIIGYTLREAAAEMKIGYWAARTTARSPEFINDIKSKSEEIARRLGEELVTNHVDMAQKLEEASNAALEEMMKMMGELDSPSKLKLQVCQDLLDRDPKSSRTKRMDITGTMSHDFISPAVLVHAAATAKEIEKFTNPKLTENNGDNSGHSSDR